MAECRVPGCTAPVYETATNVYPRCQKHQRAYWRAANYTRGAATEEDVFDVEPVPLTAEADVETEPLPTGVIDDATLTIIYPHMGAAQGLLILEAHVVQRLPMPATEGDLHQELMRFEAQGCLIALPEAPLWTH